MDAGTEAIIRKLQANFKAASGEASRQIIAEEVERFLKEGGGSEEQDIAALEDAVRNRLASRKGMSGRAEKLAAKKALFNNDQWARISAYMAFMAREDEARAAAVTRQHKRATAGAMAATAAEAEKRKVAERQHKKEELKVVEAELKEFEKDEKARRAAHAAEVGKLRGEREVQLEEQANRKQVAAELRRRGEAEVTARVAADIKHQMEAEAKAKAKAKEELKTFLLSNEVNKKIKEAEAEKERQQDISYMQQQTAQLDKQERERQMLLEKVKAVQNRQAEDAAQRPPFKRWVAEEVIEKQFQEKQAALAAEDERRKAAQTAAAARFRADISGQLSEKEVARLAEMQEKRRELVAQMEALEVHKKMSAEAKAAEMAKMKAFKAQLDAQIEENEARRHVSAMTEVERKINAKLLRDVEASGCKMARLLALFALVLACCADVRAGTGCDDDMGGDLGANLNFVALPNPRPAQTPRAQAWVGDLLPALLQKQLPLDKVFQKKGCALKSFTYQKLCVPKSGQPGNFRVKVQVKSSCGTLMVKLRVISVAGKNAAIDTWGRSAS